MTDVCVEEGYWLTRDQVALQSNKIFEVRPRNEKPYDLWVFPGQGPLALFAEAVDGWVMRDAHHVSPEERASSWRSFAAYSQSATVFRSTTPTSAGYQPVATLRWTQGDRVENLRSVHYLKQGWGESTFRKVEKTYNPDWTRTWSIDTLAVDQLTLRGVASGMQVWSALLKALYDLVFASNVGWLVGIMEEGTYQRLRGIVPGIEQIGPVKHFLHGKSVPFILEICTLQEKLDESPFADMFRYGKGFGGLMLEEIFNFPTIATQ